MLCKADSNSNKYHHICFVKELEICQDYTDAPTQGPSSPGNKHFAKNEVEKGLQLP